MVKEEKYNCLACINGFLKFPALKLYNSANATNLKRFLNKYIAIQGYLDFYERIRLDAKQETKSNNFAIETLSK